MQHIQALLYEHLESAFSQPLNSICIASHSSPRQPCRPQRPSSRACQPGMVSLQMHRRGLQMPRKLPCSARRHCCTRPQVMKSVDLKCTCVMPVVEDLYSINFLINFKSLQCFNYHLN